MASINGLEVKGVKYFPDHEGAMIPYGNLYFNGKKVGSFRTDSWGGPMQYDHTHKTISQDEVSEALHGIVSKLGWHEFYDSMDILIEELIELKEFESTFKKLQKADRIMILVREDNSQDPMKENHVRFNAAYYSPKNPSEKEINMYADKLKADYPSGVIQIFRTLDDFIL